MPCVPLHVCFNTHARLHTNVHANAHLVGGFWGCGVVTGALLCFKLKWGVIGLWCGIATGTTVTGMEICVGMYVCLCL